MPKSIDKKEKGFRKHRKDLNESKIINRVERINKNKKTEKVIEKEGRYEWSEV